MSIDLAKISKLTGFVDKLIQLQSIENSLDDSVVEQLLSQALSFSKEDYAPEELAAAKRDILWKYQIYANPGQSILCDYDQEKWYDDAKASITPKFWTRYKEYLIDEKHFSPNVVSLLGDDTLDQKLMNYILDPNGDYGNKAVLRRGLIIGDVQSGKTSTYIGFMCKAADAGYKVFILLTGTIESLRRQTQERVEEGFIGIDMSANTSGGKRVGVGLDNKPIFAMSMTSRKGDFTGDHDKIAVSLEANKDAVVFVIKKNTTSLRKLTDWLLTLNADPSTKRINMPMLLIDDEADNASINTSASKEDPTKINKLIRRLASVFSVSNYVGFTATPFANVFIDPETTEKMENHDLFPEDFIVALPTPSNYIGPDKIFFPEGEYYSQLIFIKDAGAEEADGFPFYFKHKKDWEGELPESLTDSVYTFYLANAIRDLRGEIKDHRSMLINISRFVKVQKYIKEEVERIHDDAYRSLKFNLSPDFEESMKDPILKRIYRNWEEQYESSCEFSWEDVSAVLFHAIENIQIRVVNTKSKERLEYPKNESLRVIAIGGLALSRGLTLEGLIVSYFFRNTNTYDVLMQMGRWFGYRKNYETLFRIWTHEASARWYAEIARATNQLKDEMSIMREREMKPRDFGIRVRNNSSELKITAFNKMRNTTDEYEYTSYFGGVIETPYLPLDAESHKSNYKLVQALVDNMIANGTRFERQNEKGHYILENVPKQEIINLIRKAQVSKYSSSFDCKQIAAFLETCNDESLDVFDVAFMEGTKTEDESKTVDLRGRRFAMLTRSHCTFTSEENRISIGARGKLGGTSDGEAGLSKEKIEKAKKLFQEDSSNEGKGVASDTWFKYLTYKDRKPLLLVYCIDVIAYDNQQKQQEEFKAKLNGMPAVGFGLGIPRNDEAPQSGMTKYKANKVYNWFERDEIIAESGEEE